MGNKICCRDSKKPKNPVIIQSIRTTTSLKQRIDFQQIFDFQTQFRRIYQNQLHYLKDYQSYQNVQITNINFQIQSLIAQNERYEIYLGKTDFQTNNTEMLMKVISKNNILNSSFKKSLAMQNLLMLHNEDCPFIINNFTSKQDDQNIYYFMSVHKGGDLISFLSDSSNKGYEFSQNLEQNIKFIMAGIILAFDFIHNELQLILNDLRLQYIWIDNQGYPVITDLSCIQPSKAPFHHQNIGKKAYISPQKLNNEIYTKATDYWSLDIPFDEQLFDNIKWFITQMKKKQGKIKRMSIKGSNSLKDLINCLIKINPQQRIGVKNIQDLKNHNFFKGLDWNQYENRSLKSPLKNLVNNYPFKKIQLSDQQLKISKFKIFRPDKDCSQKYLYNLQSQQEKLKCEFFKQKTFKSRTTCPFTENQLRNSKSIHSLELFDYQDEINNNYEEQIQPIQNK